MRTRRLTVAVASGAIALGAAGLVAYPAFADETPTESPSASATPTPGESDERRSRIDGALKGLVEDGTITQEQADQVAERLADSGVAGGGPHVGRWAGGPFGMALDEVAEALDMSRDEVESGLADGKSVKELAEEQGKDVGEVVDALVAAAGEQIDQAVEDGRLSQERADEIKGQLEERLTEVVENGLPKLPGLGEMGQRGDGPGFRHWHERGDDESSEPSEPSRPGATESSLLGVA